MNYTIRYFDRNDKLLDERTIEKVAVTKDTIIKTGIDKDNVSILEIDRDGDGKIDENISLLKNETDKR